MSRQFWIHRPQLAESISARAPVKQHGAGLLFALMLLFASQAFAFDEP